MRLKARWHWVVRLGLFLAAGYLALYLLLPMWVRHQALRAYPQTQGVLHVAGLDASVDIYRDPWGVAHIYARTTHDLFFAQGFVHAQERFWQMDVRRHLARGALAEMFGPAFVQDDRFFRSLGWERVVEQEWAQLTPEEKAILRAYAAGVNAYLNDRPIDALGVGYALLRRVNPTYQPEPWTPQDSLLWLKLMAWFMGSNIAQELERALLLRTLTPEQVADLYPPYPRDLPVIVPEFPVRAPEPPLPPPPDDLPPAAADALTTTALALLDLTRRYGPLFPTGGSNAWVVSGQHTASGAPLLAADPHLAYEIPSVWYQITLHCQPLGPECAYQMAGFSFPGLPGVVMGHNGTVAWAYSNLIPDVMDLVIEAVDPHDPKRYRTPTGWAAFESWDEEITVAWGADVRFRVRWTRNGPVISDWARTFQPRGWLWWREDFRERVGIEVPEAYAVSLRWTALEPTTALRAVLGFSRARDWASFRAAAHWFDTPAQNIVYADVHGTIAYQMPGKIPIRRNNDGRLPARGWTDEQDWIGYIPWEHLPYRVNPPEGYIVTANQRATPFDYPYYVAWDWAYGFRAQRIEEALRERLAQGPLDVAAMIALQLDATSTKWPILREYLLALPASTRHVADAQALLRDWDGRMDADDPAALLFAATWKHVLYLTFDEIPWQDEPRLRIHGGNRWQEVLRRILPTPHHPWWDRRDTRTRETRDDILALALDRAMTELERTWGPDRASWAWGRAHSLTLREPSLGQMRFLGLDRVFSLGPYPMPGDTAAIHAQVWDTAGTYEVLGGPTMRMVLDLGNWDRSVSALSTGQSGHPGHPHYDDLARLWARGAYYPMLWSDQAIQRVAQDHLRLEPRRGAIASPQR
ncbi:MAG: penicillin acylase family protein [Chloroflexi bacterium]|nr:penicillin acylase family protein [Chloroflexota bacterium]